MSSYSSFVNYRAEIETLFNKIMSPVRKDIDPNLVAQLCTKLNSDLDGAQIVLDLITNKMQSSQEWEAMIAFYVLEACVKTCGERFHDLVGRFRFLNEMIKLVSPKYLGNRTSEKVKKRCIEIIYSWAEGLPHKPKIKEAYDMLKKQGIVQADPENVDKLSISVQPRAKNPIFEDQNKSKELARLLKSKNPQDLEQANRLIKSMVKQDEMHTEKVSHRMIELEHINNNVKLLNDMLLNYNQGLATESEKETINFLYEELEKHRPNLVRIATETEDDDDAINEILQTNEQCERIIGQYKMIILKEKNGVKNSALDDVKLVNLNAGSLDDSEFMPKQNDNSLLLNTSLSLESSSTTSVAGKSSYDPLKELHDLFSATTTNEKATASNDFSDFTSSFSNQNGRSNPTASYPALSTANNLENLLSSINLNSNQVLLPTNLNQQKPQTVKPQDSVQTTSKPAPMKAFDELNQLGRSLFEKSVANPTAPLSFQQAASFPTSDQSKNLSLNELKRTIEPAVANSTTTESNATFTALNSLFVQLESIKPSSTQPFVMYDKNNVKIVLYFGRDQPAPGIHVMVVSVTSTNSQSSVNNFSFQAAVPKSMKVKLQPATRLDLPVFNPILPPAAITQIMLIANPNREQIRLKYKVNYSLDDQALNEPEEVKTLPMLNDLI